MYPVHHICVLKLNIRSLAFFTFLGALGDATPFLALGVCGAAFARTATLADLTAAHWPLSMLVMGSAFAAICATACA